jgi:hypothetical protein
VIVVDTNVLVYAVRPGAQTDAALAIRRQAPTSAGFGRPAQGSSTTAVRVRTWPERAS